MKNTIKLSGIIAFVAIVMFSMVACGDIENDLNDGRFDGRWYSGSTGYTFDGKNFEYDNGNWTGYTKVKGTFTYTETSISFKTTHIYYLSFHDGGDWKSFDSSVYDFFNERFSNNKSVPYSFNESSPTPLTIDGSAFYKM